ncbi:MAG: hypothetical protein KF830_11990 [Planctomycetes bacterium]|nr:hypothetical protein [Planctomycetota bacterium]
MPRYSHTQSSPLGPVFAVASAACLGGWAFAGEPVVRAICLTMAVVGGLFAAMFAQLRFEERDDHLRVRFGPLPWGGTRVPYARVRAVRRARSTVLDGWGIHWFPGRGWTFNLWGFDCVEVTTDDGLVRLGTDDADGLARHLGERSGAVVGAHG